MVINQARVKEVQSKKGFEHYKYFEDKLKILVCQIKVWDIKDPKKPTDGPTDDCITLNEVESIEIVESFKKLINTATVKFPRGTMIKKTITELNQDTADDGTAVIAKVNEEVGESNIGILQEERQTKLARTSDFASGKRIRIKLGYVTDPDDLKYINDESKNTFLSLMFDGYIIKCSVGTPIELKCENLASGLKKVSVRNISTKRDATVNDFLKKGGKYHLLDKTGLSLYPYTEACDINIGKVILSSDLTVADVLTEWSKYKLFAFIKYLNGVPYIAVGRSYFASSSKESLLYPAQSTVPTIQFDYHVAENGLTLMNTKKCWLAVEAQMADCNGKFYKVTIRENPDYDKTAKSGEKSKEFDILNEAVLSKKAQTLGAVKRSGTRNKVDLSNYTVIPFMSRRIVNKIDNKSEEQLIKEAIGYFKGHEMTGIDGSLTIFGDFPLHTAMKVELLDIRQSGKNGYYMVDEVDTSFGVNGYRQTIKLPYRLSHTDMKDSVKDNVNK